MPSSAPGDSAPIVGVLGGMGPASTAEFLARLVRKTPAASDQEHLRTIVWSDPTIPDRSDALLGQGPDPTSALVAGVRRLVGAGADVLVIPCNTAHAFLVAVREASRVPVLSMIDAAAAAAVSDLPPGSRVGLVATTGTLASRVYDEALGRHGVAVVTPDASRQVEVMAAIRAVKAGSREDTAFRATMEALAAGGASRVIAGCTEVLLARSPEDVVVPVIDPVDAIIDRLLDWAGLLPVRGVA